MNPLIRSPFFSKYSTVSLLLLTFLQGQSHLAAMSKANLVANGDFSSQDSKLRPLRWTVGTELQTATISAAENHGSNRDDTALEMADGSDTQSLSVMSEKRIANPGTVYELRAWTKAKNGAPASLHLDFWNQAGERIATSSAAPGSGPEWEEVTVSLPAPDAVTHVSARIGSDDEAVGVSYWDDVSLLPQVAYHADLQLGVRELFLDDYRLESSENVQRVVHPGEKSEPLLTPTKPWEGDMVYIYGTVIKDEPPGTGYRMWYTTYSDKTYLLCYATSMDGITWDKPNLGVYDWNGSKENNIIRKGGGTLVYDPDDDDPRRRYKLMAQNRVKSKPGYAVFFSADGITWNSWPGNPVIEWRDVSAVAYDRAARLFIATTKQRMKSSLTSGKLDRSAHISVSNDFTKWTSPGAPSSTWTLAVEGDPIDDLTAMAAGGIEAQIYGMPIYPYESLYIGMPWVFTVMNYTTGPAARAGDGPVEPQLAVSRDLRHWSRPIRDPILPLGKAGAWDDSTIYTASNLLVTSSGLELYYGAMNFSHGGGTTSTQKHGARIAKATWRRDGFVSLHNAGDDTGVITTRKLSISDARTLNVNAAIRPGGSLKVEVLDAHGTPLPGFSLAEAESITGDSDAEISAWKGQDKLAALNNQPFKLRFHLKGGDLYSYWFD